MVDLISQYERMKEEIDKAVLDVIASAKFIKGPELVRFERNLAEYLGVNNVIGCANGTDALQIALMALELKPGDEVVVPAFTYVATAEVIGLLGLTPIMVDVDERSFNITSEIFAKAITPRTKAVVPVHLFGQSADIAGILEIAKSNDIYVIEDNAQAIGSRVTLSDNSQVATGISGHIGCTSFFPSKNLGCYGDGGALFTTNDELASKIRMIANHGQEQKYHHSMIGCNSRLDTLQAAILDVKLKYLDEYCNKRQLVAAKYNNAFADIDELQTPYQVSFSTHVYHQYTLKVLRNKRDELKTYLNERGIPVGVYYPLPLYKQKAFRKYIADGFELSVTEQLCASVLSLPIHTEMDEDIQAYIIETILDFYR